jgi:putative hydrolase of the HAD superfamily
MEPIPTGTKPRLQKLSDIRFVMYDFYGTLFLSGVGDIGIDDGTSDAGLMNEALRGAGVTMKSPKAGARSMKLYNRVVDTEIDRLKSEGIQTPEPDIREIWSMVLSELKNEELIDSPGDEETAMRISVEFEARMNPVWPVDGVAGALQHLKKRGFHQGIISNSQFYTPLVLQALTGKSLTELGFDDRLLHWSFRERMKKPDIVFYKRFMDSLTRVFPKSLPHEVLYIGNDMLKDVWPASELGMKTALFAGDKRSLKWRRDDERCRDLEPDVIITNFQQMEEIL